jgi:hypothetical protein
VVAQRPQPASAAPLRGSTPSSSSIGAAVRISAARRAACWALASTRHSSSRPVRGGERAAMSSPDLRDPVVAFDETEPSR